MDAGDFTLFLKQVFGEVIAAADAGTLNSMGLDQTDADRLETAETFEEAGVLGGHGLVLRMQDPEDPLLMPIEFQISVVRSR